MTIKEFINALDDSLLYAEYDEQGNVYIYDNSYDDLLVQLGIDSSVWEVEDDTFTMSPSLLRLMAKLADTPPAKRKESPKYVILNAMPVYEEHFIWHFFRIGEDGEYLKACKTNDPAILINSAYTLDELEYKKAWLPKLWRNAIDNMLTPLELALEVIH